VLRPRRSSNLLRVLVTAAGDIGVAIAALAIGTLLRRSFELPLTRDLLPAEKFALDLPTVLLFVLPLLLALELTGFYTVSSSPRHRPTVLLAVPLQVALVATIATFLGLLLPRSVLAVVAVLELVLLPLWRRLVRRLVPLRRRRVALVGMAEELAEPPPTSPRSNAPTCAWRPWCRSTARSTTPPSRASTGTRRRCERSPPAEEVIDVSPAPAAGVGSSCCAPAGRAASTTCRLPRRCCWRRASPPRSATGRWPR
jgi:hypothetical protein